MLLGIMVAVLLPAVLSASFAALQYTRSAVLRDEQKQVAGLSDLLARGYLHNLQLRTSSDRPDALLDRQFSPRELSDLTRSVLRNAEEVQGGFYVAQRETLLGDSFAQVPGDAADGSLVPEDARPTILQTAQEAVASGRPVGHVSAIGSDVALVDATPIFANGQIMGCAWTIKRLANIPGTNRWRAYLIATGLGIAALACVILTLLVVQALQNGVRKIEDGLENLESTLSSQISIDSDPEEIRKIAEAINRLAGTLKAKIDGEKEIEDRLRHAERLVALGRLIAGVAHEVRNPLATIRLRVQMCQDSGNLEVRESCIIALQEIERLDGMVSRLLSFSRPVNLRTETTSLERLVEQRLANFTETARQRSIRLLTRFDGRSHWLPADQGRLGQVFDNIIQNAIEAMCPAGGTLCVSVGSQMKAPGGNEEVYVEFNDTGEGMAAEVQGRIFDPFFTTKATGTGLGLSICHELVQAHGGKIEIASAQACGTTVRVSLPADQKAVAGHVA